MIDPIQAIGASIDPRAARLAAAVAPRADGATTDASAKDDAAHTATRKVAQDFTSLLVGTLVREMFQSVSESENGPSAPGPTSTRAWPRTRSPNRWRSTVSTR